MADFDIDIVEGSSLKRTSSGYEKVRIAKVWGLTGSPSAREYNAMNLEGVPQKGDSHPDIPIIRVAEQDARADGPDLVEVRLLYKTIGASYGTFGGDLEVGDPPILEIGANLESRRTDVDINGDGLLVVYSGDASLGESKIQEYRAEVNFPRPSFFLRYTRRETEPPDNIAATYCGKVNSGEFADKSARTLLMGPIQGQSDDGGATFLTTYEMYFERDTWDVVLKAMYDDTGKIPKGISEGNGRHTYRVIEEVDFSGLGL